MSALCFYVCKLMFFLLASLAILHHPDQNSETVPDESSSKKEKEQKYINYREIQI